MSDIETLGVEAGSMVEMEVSTTDVELVEAPLWDSRDDDGAQLAVLPDEEAELVIDRVFYDATGSGSFFLHGGDNTAIGGITVTYSATPGVSVLDFCGKHMGFGNPVLCDPTITSGSLRIKVEHHIERRPYRRRARVYLDA